MTNKTSVSPVSSVVEISPRSRAAISWSGGKDSCAALQRVHSQFDVVSMVTMFDEDAVRSRSHGLRPEVIAAQASRLGMTQFIGRCTWDTYNAVFERVLSDVAASGVTPASRVQLTLAPANDNDENDPEFLDVTAIAGSPQSNQILVSASFSAPVSGPIKLNWSAI